MTKMTHFRICEEPLRMNGEFSTETGYDGFDFFVVFKISGLKLLPIHFYCLFISIILIGTFLYKDRSLYYLKR